MKWNGRSSWLCLALGLVAVAVPRMGAAQLAPTGGHYAGRASDTGTEPGVVNASGGYTASVPLELPAARGDLPIPLAITSGARGVGAVGRGWDIPLSYIRRDTTYAHRKPRIGSDVPPQGREQVTLSIQGQSMDLLPKGQTWVARYNAPDLSLREQDGTWVMYDGQGNTWTFVEPSLLAGSGLWLLSTIRGSDNTAVQLEYDLSTVTFPDSSGVSIDLRRILYNKHPQSDCYKHEITLTYGATAATPLALTMLGERVLTRMRTLSTVDVGSRASCAGSTEKLRTYSFTYLPDADTQQPRLSAVHLLGRQGTPEQSVPLPVASFGYGSATTNGRLSYQKTQSIPMPTGSDITKISATVRDGTFTPPVVASGTGLTTWQSLTDVTGDGLPDLVFQQSGKLWVALNRPGGSGTTTLGAGTAIGQLADTTFTAGPFETRSATHNRFTNNSSAVNIDKAWRQAIDVNGDGRVDIIDAAEAAGQWVIYLNTPGTSASGIKWERRAYNILPLYHHLWLRGHSLSHDYLPLSSRFSGRDRSVGACWRYTGTQWVSYPEGFTSGDCYTYPNGELSSGEEKTYTQWEVKDINGDGFPELVFNSSRVDVVPRGGPSYEGFPGQIVNTPLMLDVQPVHGSANKIDAVLNLYGLFIEENSPVFSAPITLEENTSCGVGLWATSLDKQQTICGLADVNGDGLLDRIEDKVTAYLGTGRGFSSVKLTLPGTFATQTSMQFITCAAPEPDAPGSTTFVASQRDGLRDLTGDGIPDFATYGSGSTWSVSIGTGTGFAPPVSIEVVGSGFSISSARERCDGTTSLTQGGLYDINGDGKPEVVHLNGAYLDVYQLSGDSLPGKPEAGRLVQVDNGYGARTTVGYRSAKEDGTTRHQVPFPEIVVTSVTTTGTQGLGGSLAATRYAYGGAELMYDSVLHTFTMPGYQRSVELRTTPGARTAGYVTLTDTYPLPPFTATSKSEHFGRYLLAGKVRDVTVLSGVNADPWSLLTVDVTTSNYRIGGTHHEWATKFFEEPPAPDSTNTGLDCLEMAYPLDFLASWLANTHAYNACTAHGFMYARTTDSWRGQAAPPSTSNVATRSEVLDVDDFGRVLTVYHRNDVHRGDDDICVETQYAAPVGTNERILHAPSSRRYWDCTRPDLPTYAAESWQYDHLTAGYVSAGHLTAHSRERRDASTGALLNTVLEYTASYDAAGNPATVTRVREDGAVRTVSLSYDTFGLAQVGQRVDATGLPALSSSATLDEVSLETLSTLDPNQTRSGTDFDGYGRPVRATVTPPGGPLGVMATTSYLGFSGTDPLGRRITGKSFSDPVTPGTEGSAPGRTHTVYLDELGRSRRTESALGPDYGNELMIAGARTYDVFGRVIFEADPYPASQNGATAYGTTTVFYADGTVACTIRGHGPQAYSTVTDEALERYPTCYSRSFQGYQETVAVSDASSLLATSSQAGVSRSATLTATGRLISRSTFKGTSRLEHAFFTHDRLGQLTGMTRYLDPALLSGPVQWSWTYDSLGQRIQWQAPESPVQTARFSDWGEPLEVSWTDSLASPAGSRSLHSSYDALGRVTRQEERINGVVDGETVNTFFYDVGASPTSLVNPTYVLGRLAHVEAPTGEVFYSYDAFGRQNTRTFTDTLGGTYVEKSQRHADGTLGVLEFYLPDAYYKPERVYYTYDSARRLNGIQYTDSRGARQLFTAEDIDPFGRVRKARHGGVATFEALYSDLGRRLLNQAAVSSIHGSRSIIYLGYDSLGRETVRREITNGALTGPKTNVGYDALGRLSSSLRTTGKFIHSNWQYTYDALGNVLTQNDLLGSNDATLSYRTGDRDRLCRIGYGNNGLGGTACNVSHDGLGNVLEQPTRTGVRRLQYFPSGDVRSISEPSGNAFFRYGALGTVRELDLRVTAAEARHEWKFGGLIERKEQVIGGTLTSVITRNIPGPGGIVASRRGTADDWIFHFGEMRGARFSTDNGGAFVQDIDYQPFGEARSTGLAQPGTLLYSSAQWNGGDTLASFGLSQLGARLYDPVVGRFLSRDPLFVPRTAATTNPYAFAMNDPLNQADPTGLDPSCIGQECSGGGGGGFPGGGGGPSEINPPGLYLPAPAPASGGVNPQAAYRPSPTAVFAQAPTGPQTVAGATLQAWVAINGVTMPEGFNFDTLAATGISVEDALNTIANTQEGAEAAVAEYNARIDRWSSFSAGLGDSVMFWCPGCTQNMRRTWLGPNNSGDANGWYYLWGSITGIAGSFALPQAKSVIKPPKGDVKAELRAISDEAFVNACSNGRNCGYVAIAFHAARRGLPPGVRGTSGMAMAQLEQYFNSTFVAASSQKAIVRSVKAWADGSDGIVAGIFMKGGQQHGHVFNVVNRGGKVYFIDASVPWAPVSFDKYTDLWLMKTP